MNTTLDRFILGIPRLFIKQYPYAWFPLIALWTWPPNLSIIFLLIILLGLSMLRWQYAAWISDMRTQHAGKDGKFHLDAPTVSLGRSVRNIVILLAGAGLIASLLNGQLGLSFWQFFLIFIGFTMTYYDFRFFGYPAVYIVTAAGIAVYFAPGHLDYRLFFTFKEIARIERAGYQKDKNWSCFARTRDVGADGLLLTPKDAKGFSKSMEKVFITPSDIEEFLKQLPYGYGR